MVKLFSILILITFSFNGFSQNVPMYSKYEHTFNFQSLSLSEAQLINNKNPFDKNEIIVQINITRPNGDIDTINAFYYEDYVIVDDINNHHNKWPFLSNQQLFSTNNFVWKFRYSPTVTGVFNYSIRVILPNENLNLFLESGSFNCFSSQNKGFVKMVNEQFTFNNGEIFKPVGINVNVYPPWSQNGPKVNFYDLMFKRLHDNGGNFARIWVNFCGSMSLVGVQDFRNNIFFEKFSLEDSYVFDRILMLAEYYNVKLQVCFFSANNFNTNDINGYSFWSNYNSYNVVNGGSCVNPVDFFSNITALRQQENFFKYVIDRWGYSTSIQSWEFFNELDFLLPNGISTNDYNVINWHHDMYSLIKGYDINQRAITTSFGGGGDSPTPFMINVINTVDFSSVHRYTDPISNPNQLSYDVYKSSVNNYRSLTNVPITIGEGQCFMQPHLYPGFDSVALNYHSDLWSTLFMGSGPLFYWSYDMLIKRNSPTMESTNYFKQLKGIREFINLIDDGENFLYKTINPISNDGLRSFYMQDNVKSKLYGWIQDESFTINNLIDYSNGTTVDYLIDFDISLMPIRSSQVKQLKLNNLPNLGLYKVLWYDTETGDNVGVDYSVSTNTKTILLNLPNEFSLSKYGDIAFVIELVDCGYDIERIAPTFYNDDDVQIFTEIKLQNNKIFYTRADGVIYHKYKDVQTGSWVSNPLCIQAPKMLNYTFNSFQISVGLEVIDSDIFYVSYNGFLNHIYYDYSSNTWQWEPLSLDVDSKARVDSEVHYKDGIVYYIGRDNKIKSQELLQGNWVWSYLDFSLPDCWSGTGSFTISESFSSLIYCISNTAFQKFELVSSNSEVISIGSTYNFINSSSKLREIDNGFYYVREDGRIICFIYYNNSWLFYWVAPNAPRVKEGSSIVLNKLANYSYTLLYSSIDNNIIKLSKSPSSSSSWDYKFFNLNFSHSYGVNTQLVSNDEYIFYVGYGIDNSYNVFDNHFIFGLKNNCATVDPNVDYKPTKKELEIENSNEETILLYPNPSSNHIVYFNVNNDFSIKVFDNLGRVLDVEFDVSLNGIDLSPYKRGVYYVEFIKNNNKRVLKKIILL